MHDYLKAIGYGNITSQKQLNEFLKDAEKTFSHHESIAMEEALDFCEYQKECGPGIGVDLCGSLDLYDIFERQYYYPYFIGKGVTSYADITVEKRMDREAFVGICEDMKVGISLIFYLQNTLEYLIESRFHTRDVHPVSVTLAGLCNSGTILLPIQKSEEQEKIRRQESKDRKMLMNAAKNGDQEAMESLTLEDIDTYSRVSQRLIYEDVFSIVDTYFMPCGIECDRYSILGEILELYTIQNEDSGEKLYVMRLDVNELQFDICVPVKDVLGEPEEGRRFKGDIWLQGRLNF